MLTFSELQARLTLDRAKLLQLVKEGLPRIKEGRAWRYDEELVAAWLLATGRAEAASAATDQSDGKIARTRREAADHFGVGVRTVAQWQEEEGFPGRPGRPGKREGYYPLAAIQEWLDKTKQTSPAASGGGGPRPHDELASVRAAKERLLYAQLEGRLVDAAEVERLVRRQIATARAILDPLPERVVACLPPDASDDLRVEVSQLVDRCLSQSYQAIAEILSGDKDEPTREEEGPPPSAAKPRKKTPAAPNTRKRAAKRKSKRRQRRATVADLPRRSNVQPVAH